MAVYFIINPVAGKGQGKVLMEEMSQQLKQSGIEYNSAYTQYPGHATELAAQVDSNKFSTIVAVGGDGTIYEVINGMQRKSISLGIIPIGTGNDLARSAEIPMEKKEALEVILKGKRKWIDIGSINNKLFINVAGVGLDVEVLREAKKFKTIIKGSAAYILGLIKALFTFKAIDLHIFIDGKEYKEQVMLCAVANGKYYGGGMKIVPLAELEDGFLNICLIKKMSKLRLLFVFPRVFTGKHIDLPWVKLIKGKNIGILSKNGIWVNADGEISKEFSPKFEILEKGLNILVPREAESKMLIQHKN